MEGMLCGLVGLVFGLAILVAAIVVIARWVLRPLDQAAKGREAPAQFTLVDFLCLVFMAQLPTGLVRWAFRESGESPGPRERFTRLPGSRAACCGGRRFAPWGGRGSTAPGSGPASWRECSPQPSSAPWPSCP